MKINDEGKQHCLSYNMMRDISLSNAGLSKQNLLVCQLYMYTLSQGKYNIIAAVPILLYTMNYHR